jgi:hypothetical protein
VKSTKNLLSFGFLVDGGGATVSDELDHDEHGAGDQNHCQ